MFPRLALAAAPLLFAFQCWVIAEYGEPYPAMTLPGFGRVPVWSEVERPSVIVMVAGRVAGEHSIAELLPDHSRTHQAVIAFGRLHHSSAATPAVSAWLLRRGRRLHPDADRVIIRWHKRDLASGSIAWAGDFSTL